MAIGVFENDYLKVSDHLGIFVHVNAEELFMDLTLPLQFATSHQLSVLNA